VRGSASHHTRPIRKPSSEHSQNVVTLMQVAAPSFQASKLLLLDVRPVRL
jgi:hypothetical protein